MLSTGIFQLRGQLLDDLLFATGIEVGKVEVFSNVS
jgi:hypothetical protein